VEVQLSEFLTRHYIKVSGQLLNAAALTQMKTVSGQIGRRTWVCPKVGCILRRRKQKFIPLQRI